MVVILGWEPTLLHNKFVKIVVKFNYYLYLLFRNIFPDVSLLLIIYIKPCIVFRYSMHGLI